MGAAHCHIPTSPLRLVHLRVTGVGMNFVDKIGHCCRVTKHNKTPTPHICHSTRLHTSLDLSCWYSTSNNHSRKLTTWPSHAPRYHSAALRTSEYLHTCRMQRPTLPRLHTLRPILLPPQHYLLATNNFPTDDISPRQQFPPATQHPRPRTPPMSQDQQSAQTGAACDLPHRTASGLTCMGEYVRST
jgi:hypothetical protein